MNIVVCYLALVLNTGGLKNFELKGKEIPSEGSHEYIYVDFSENWPRGVRGPMVRFVRENDCNYLKLEVK